MYYARWAEKEEMKEVLKEVKQGTQIEEGGIPILYENDSMYVSAQGAHTLIIGSSGSGKTQTTLLPLCRLAIKAEESLLVHDKKGELYHEMIGELEKENYNVIVLDFENSKVGDGWNPLTLPYMLYKKGETDKALEIVENIGYYLITEKNYQGDPFWTLSAMSYFTGLTFYLFENAKEEEIHLNSVFALSNALNQKGEGTVSQQFMDSLEKTSLIYTQLSSILLAPPDTRGSIVSVFSQKIKNYVTRENLSLMLSQTDFDMCEIGKKKTAIFLITGMNEYTNFLVPLFVHQVFHSVNLFGTKKKRFHVLLDEFENMLPIYTFNRVLQYARSIYMDFTVAIQSLTGIKNVYGRENTELMKLCFENIIYLLSNDTDTWAEISKMCGTHLVQEKVVPLVSAEELKTLKPFEAIVIMTRMMPYKTKLLPDYQMNWNFVKDPKEIKNFSERSLHLFDLQEKM